MIMTRIFLPAVVIFFTSTSIFGMLVRKIPSSQSAPWGLHQRNCSTHPQPTQEYRDRLCKSIKVSERRLAILKQESDCNLREVWRLESEISKKRCCVRQSRRDQDDAHNNDSAE